MKPIYRIEFLTKVFFALTTVMGALWAFFYLPPSPFLIQILIIFIGATLGLCAPIVLCIVFDRIFIRPLKFFRIFIKDPKNSSKIACFKIKHNYKFIITIIIVTSPAFLISVVVGLMYGFYGYIFGAASGIFFSIFLGQTYSLFEKLYKKWIKSPNSDGTK